MLYNCNFSSSKTHIAYRSFPAVLGKFLLNLMEVLSRKASCIEAFLNWFGRLWKFLEFFQGFSVRGTTLTKVLHRFYKGYQKFLKKFRRLSKVMDVLQRL